MKKFILFICFIFAFGAMAARIGDDTLRVGTKTGSDILIEMGEGILKWDSGTSKLQLSNNSGGVFNDIPSGLSNSANLVENSTVDTSVAANALTIDLKVADGISNPSAADGVRTAFRDVVAADGSYNIVNTLGARTIVVPSGATLGHLDGDDGFIYIYLLDNAGVTELALSSVVQDESKRQTTVTISTGSDDSGFYSTTGRTDVPIRLIARLISNQATAGTYAIDVVKNAPGAHLFTDITDSLAKRIIHGDSVSQITCAGIIETFGASGDVEADQGDCIDSTTVHGLGDYSANFISGYFASTSRLVCTCSGQDNVAVHCHVNSANDTAARFRIRNTSDTLFDAVSSGEGFSFDCTGNK